MQQLQVLTFEWLHFNVSSQVHKIPETFKSPKDYKNSFIPLLLEETRCDLSSSLFCVSRAPFCEIHNVEESDGKQLNFPKSQKQFKLFQQIIRLKSTTHHGNYEPGSGDLILLTNIRPKSLDDLKTLKSSYHFGYVNRAKNHCSNAILVMSSKSVKMDMDIPYDLRNKKEAKEVKMYAVYLMNMTTNVRIWNALNSQSEGEHLNIIKKVLQLGLNVRITWSFFSLFVSPLFIRLYTLVSDNLDTTQFFAYDKK